MDQLDNEEKDLSKDEQLQEQEEALAKQARKLAYFYQGALKHRSNSWFKPIHLKRELKESESIISQKLDILVRLGFAVAKKSEGKDMKYMIQIDDEQKKKYYQEVRDQLQDQLKEVNEILEKFN
tara:strand:+ start:3131 stop:3502 length:372 start_codon:yes stop_codon:yes gene_type:complete